MVIAICFDVWYKESHRGTGHLKRAADLPMGAPINHAKSSACSRAPVLMSGLLNSSTAQIPINISAVVFGRQPASYWAGGHSARCVSLHRSDQLIDRDSPPRCKLAESPQQSRPGQI